MADAPMKQYRGKKRKKKRETVLQQGYRGKRGRKLPKSAERIRKDMGY